MANAELATCEQEAFMEDSWLHGTVSWHCPVRLHVLHEVQLMSGLCILLTVACLAGNYGDEAIKDDKTY